MIKNDMINYVKCSTIYIDGQKTTAITSGRVVYENL